jgi:hypothetical protein
MALVILLKGALRVHNELHICVCGTHLSRRYTFEVHVRFDTVQMKYM